MPKCAVHGCGNEAIVYEPRIIVADAPTIYCAMHAQRVYRHGSLVPPGRTTSWTADDEAHISGILDRQPDGLGNASRSEMRQLAERLGRTENQIIGKLWRERRKRQRVQAGIDPAPA